MECLPSFWNDQGVFIPNEENKVKFQEKRNDISQLNHTSSNLIGKKKIQPFRKIF